MLRGALLACASLGIAASAEAATIVVKTEKDRGPGSLRGAIGRAEPGDTVRVPRGEYLLTRGELVVETPITIRGTGARRTIVDAQRRSRVMEIKADATDVRIRKLTVRGGSHEDFGAGILSAAALTLERARITRNRVADGETARFGAGIHATGDVTLRGTTVSRNVVVGGTGQNFGAGISLVTQGGDLRLLGSRVTGNRITGPGGSGAGGFMSSIPAAGQGPPNLVVRRSTIAGNRSPTLAGGLAYQLTDGIGYESSVRITDSTVAGNAASGGFQSFGGGLYLSAVLTTAAARVEYVLANSTISGNEAGSATARGSGGGAYLSAVSLNGSVATTRLNNVTVAGNRAFVTEDGGGGGGIHASFTGGGDPELTNSIVAGNRAPGTPDCEGPVVSGGNNLERRTSCGFAAAGDLQDTDPLLERLKANGGPTTTRALKRGSPALNGGSNATCEPRDQRGVRRPQGPRCDIGAYERKR